MDLSDAIDGYRAIRQFDPRPLSTEDLDAILRAGRRAPSSKNTQRWGFVAVTDRVTLELLSKVGDFAGHLAGAAAGVAIVVPDDGDSDGDADARKWIALDSGQAAQNMLLTAWSLGIGGVHAAVYDQAAAREILGYPRESRCDLILSLGYPADPSMLTASRRPGGRRPVSEVVHRDHW